MSQRESWITQLGVSNICFLPSNFTYVKKKIKPQYGNENINDTTGFMYRNLIV